MQAISSTHALSARGITASRTPAQTRSAARTLCVSGDDAASPMTARPLKRAAAPRALSKCDEPQAARREFIAALAAAGALAGLSATRPALADELQLEFPDAPTPPPTRAPVANFEGFENALLAYAFKYPASLPSGESLGWAFSRRPEKYSSAAPLNADARQRIVMEKVNLAKSITLSVAVGPPPEKTFTGEPSTWNAEQVAQIVLADKSTARVSTGQRVSLSNVENARRFEEGGVQYFSYEHISQGSPNPLNLAKETYRHSASMTAYRDGFFYTLNITAPEEMWEQVGDAFLEGAESFRLTAPGRGFVSPDSTPLQFW